MNGAIVGLTNLLVGGVSATALLIGNFAWHVVVAVVLVCIDALVLSVEAAL